MDYPYKTFCDYIFSRFCSIVRTNRLPIDTHWSYARGQSLYAIKVLRCHGMNEEQLRLVYKSFVLAKLMYASPAWLSLIHI